MGRGGRRAPSRARCSVADRQRFDLPPDFFAGFEGALAFESAFGASLAEDVEEGGLAAFDGLAELGELAPASSFFAPSLYDSER